jgi:ubiquitin-protein ligase
MADPSTENPVMPAIAQQMLKNSEEFYETARKYTATYAQSKTK